MYSARRRFDSCYRLFGMETEFIDIYGVGVKIRMCGLCRNGENKINFISGANITSYCATFDVGLIKNVNFCPVCGKPLNEESRGKMRPIIHANTIIDWPGDCKCSNCESSIDITEPYCQHCGATIDERSART